jgi:large subunit ribosomal protein LP2
VLSWCCAVGAEADDDRISFLLGELKGKDILEVIASGKEKFASVPSGGGGGAVVSSGGGGAAPAAAAAEEKKEEKKEEEPKEESDDVSVFLCFMLQD